MPPCAGRLASLMRVSKGLHFPAMHAPVQCTRQSPQLRMSTSTFDSQPVSMDSSQSASGATHLEAPPAPALGSAASGAAPPFAASPLRLSPPLAPPVEALSVPLAPPGTSPAVPPAPPGDAPSGPSAPPGDAPAALLAPPASAPL